MSAINLSFRHNQTQEEARTRLGDVVTELRNRCGFMIQRVDWSADGNRVHLAGTGFQVDAWVDAAEAHLIGDIPLLAGLLGGPLLASKVKQIMQRGG